MLDSLNLKVGDNLAPCSFFLYYILFYHLNLKKKNDVGAVWLELTFFFFFFISIAKNTELLKLLDKIQYFL